MAERRQEVVLVRHGETEWSKSGQHTGTTDIPLTDTGREQARAVAPALAEREFTLVLTSPMQRATETCELAGLDEAAQRRDELREWNYGEYEGRTTPEIREEVPGWTVWTGIVPGGETAGDVGARTDRVIDEIRTTEGDVAVFAHGHVLRVFAARWIGLDPTDGRRLALGTATLCILGYERETPVIVRWNVPVTLLN